MAEARVMDQLSSGDSSSDSNSSSSSSSDDSSSSSDSEQEQPSVPTPAPAKHSMPVINPGSETISRHQERAGGLMNTLSELLHTLVYLRLCIVIWFQVKEEIHHVNRSVKAEVTVAS